MISRPRSRASSMALPLARSGSMSGNPTVTTAVTPPSSTLEALLYIVGWYIFSLSISIYNKWMFGPSLDFHFPILITSFHQFCLFILSSFVLYLRPRLRPDPDAMDGNAATATNSPTSTERSPSKFFASCRIPLSIYVRSIIPCSVASAGDIGLSNVSFKFISLSLYTMIKTSSLGFVLLFGLFFGLEKFRWNLVLIVITMLFSVLLMVKKDNVSAAIETREVNHEDDSDNSVGIILVLGALMMSGLRWSFTQLLLKHNDYTTNSISTIFFLSPGMCGILFLTGLLFEGWGEFLSSPIWDIKGVFGTVILMIIPGILAFLMTLCEFRLLSVAQVVTLSIAGIFKELLTILLSAIIFGDRLSWVNCLGLVLTFLDIIWYNYYRYTQKNASNSNGNGEYQGVPTEDESDIELKKL